MFFMVYEMYLISHIIQVSLHRFLSNNRVHNVIKINLKDKKISL